MAITAATLTSAGITTDGTTFTTASITPGANRLVLASVFGRVASGTTPTPTLSGNGLTWVLMGQTATGAATRICCLYRAMGAAPTAGAVTITVSAAWDGAIWQISEFTGVDTSGTNGSGAIVAGSFVNFKSPSTVTSVSVALGATVSAGNAAYGAVGISINTALTAGTGWTDRGQAGINTPTESLMGESAVPAVQNILASWTGVANAFVTGVEIAAAPAASFVPAHSYQRMRPQLVR